MIAKDKVSHRVWTTQSGFFVYINVELVNKAPVAVDAKLPFYVHDTYDRLKSHGALVFANVKIGETARERRLMYFAGDGPRSASVGGVSLYELDI